MSESWQRRPKMPCINSNWPFVKVRRLIYSSWILASFPLRSDLPTQTFSRTAWFNTKNARISLIILIAFAVPLLLAVIVGCVVRTRNLRKSTSNLVLVPQIAACFSSSGKLRRLDAFLIDEKNTDTSQGSILADWRNRRKGFQRLEQYSDGENEPLKHPMDDDSDNETITIPSKQQTTVATNQSKNIAF